MTRRVALLAAFVFALACAPSAGAATASVVGSTLTYVAAPGENNTVSIAYDAKIGSYRFTDTTAPVTGGSGCGAIEHELDCVDNGISVIVVNLRDGDDKWLGGDIKVVPAVDGGAGNDDLSGIGFLNGGDGNDTLKGLDGGAQLDGGAGNDTLVGGEGDDLLDGGPGDDLLIGNDGSDTFVGGLGLDRIDASGDGGKTVDCQGRDDEIVQGETTNVKLVGCSGAPTAQISAARVRVSRLVKNGMQFTVSCDRPCAVYWELIPDKRVRKLVRHDGGWLDRHVVVVDGDGFRNPISGTQRFTARVIGNATKKALKRLKSFSATLGVQVYSRDGLSTKQFKKIKIG